MEVLEETAEVVKNVPDLRFPEFKGEWQKTKLGDFLTFKNGVNADKEKYGFGYKFINVMDIINNRFITHDKIIGSVEISEKDFEKNEVKYGDILFQRSSETREEVGQSNVYLDKDRSATFGGFVIRGQATKEYNPMFINFLLKTDFARKEITTKSGGSTRYNVGQDTLKEVNVILPTIPEQEKITSFLSVSDDKIQQLSKKKVLLEKYKKGVMQKIFSRQIRFKDDNGNDFPEWEEKKLGDVLDFYPTNSFSRSLLNYEKGSIKNIHYGDIHTKYRSNFDITKENVPYINVKVDISRIIGSSYCQVGDLVIADASEDYKDIGKSIEIVNLNNESVLAGLHTYIARDNNNVFALGFKGYLMQSRKVRLQMMRFATGVSVLGISKGNIAKVEIGLPGLEEQRKIVSFLTSVDIKINYTSKQLEQTQQFKKGLLQQMFV